MGDYNLSDERYLAALYRQRDRIIDGAPFAAVDSEAIGDKYTEASWGLCSHEKDAWPDRNDHLWPDQFDKGRIAPKYRENRHRCPMDARPLDKIDGNGCFYKCKIFKTREIKAKDAAKAIALYEEAIGEARKPATRTG